MEIDALFLSIMGDLYDRVTTNDSEYELLNVARLIRQLLLDGSQSVAFQANRPEGRRVKFVFQVNDNRVGDMDDVLEGLGAPKPFLEISTGLSPRRVQMAAPPIECTLNQFLAWPVVKVSDNTYTVHQVIDLCAHVTGAVHAGSAAPDVAALRELQSQIQLMGLEPAIYALRDIGLVVLDGLAELYLLIDPD